MGTMLVGDVTKNGGKGVVLTPIPPGDWSTERTTTGAEGKAAGV